MKISQIAFVNFMGGTGNHITSPLTLITGKNRKGKTRIQRAAQLAIGGFVPGMGRRNGDIFDDLGNGNPLSVMASFQDARLNINSSIRREYSKNRNTVTCNIVPVNLPPAWSVPPVLNSAKEYFELGSKDRINFLFSAMDLSAAEFSVEKLLADVKNIKLEENTEQTETVIREICDEIMSGDQLREHAEQSLQAWLDELSETLETKLSDATAAVKRMDGTVKGLIELGAQSQATPVAASVEGELIQARKDLADAEAEVRRLEAAAKTITQNQARKTQIETELAKPHKNGREEKKATIGKHRETIAAYNPTARQEAANSLSTLAGELGKLEAEKSTLGKQRADAVKEHTKIMTLVQCPCCDSEGTDWRERVQKKHDKAMKIIDKRLGEIETKHKATTALKASAEAVLKGHQTAEHSAHTSQTEVTKLEREISTIEREDETIKSLRRELESLQAIGSPASKDAAIKTRDDAQTRVTELEGKNNQLIQERAAISQQTQAVEAGKLNIAEKKITKAALDIVMAAKDKLTEQTIKPLLEVANSICQPLLDQPLEYLDGQIGWTIPGIKKFQAHTTFCGAEEAIVFSALQIALALRSPIKVVMIDELGTIDDERKIKLVLLMRELVMKGQIDQFIGNDVSDKDYMQALDTEAIADFTFINL